jgi:transposase
MRRFQVLLPHLDDGVPLARAAAEADVPLRTAQRWLQRYRAGGLGGLARSPCTSAGRLTDAPLVKVIEGMALRKPRPSLASITRRAAGIAAAQGSNPVCYSTVRAIVGSLNPAMLTLAHDGPEVFRDTYELVYRRGCLRPNQMWQADHTQLDILVLDAASPASSLGIGLGEYPLPPLASPRREADVAGVGPFLDFGDRLLAPFDEISVELGDERRERFDEVKPLWEGTTGVQQLIDERLALGVQLTSLSRGGF